MSQKNYLCVRKLFYPYPPEIKELNLPLSTNEIGMCGKKGPFTNSIFSMSKVVLNVYICVFIFSCTNLADSCYSVVHWNIKRNCHYFLLKYCKDAHSPSISAKNKSPLLERRTILFNFVNILWESCIITFIFSGRLSRCERILPLSSHRGVERSLSTMFYAIFFFFLLFTKQLLHGIGICRALYVTSWPSCHFWNCFDKTIFFPNTNLHNFRYLRWSSRDSCYQFHLQIEYNIRSFLTMF